MDKDERKKLVRKAQARGVAVNGTGGYTHHILLCTGPSCCSPDEGQAARKALNKHLRQLRADGRAVYASHVSCLSFCRGGPVAVVYPEGTWYGHADAEGCARIALEHLRDGRVVEDLAFARNPLPLKAPEPEPEEEDYGGVQEPCIVS